MITYQVEQYEDSIEELIPLVHEHSSEIDKYQEYFTLDPDYTVYQWLADQDKLYIITARDDEELVGYLVFFINPHIHYKDIVYAENDLIFIKPEYRHTGIIQELFDYAENDLKLQGVDVITFHMKDDHKFEGLANKMGYDKAEIMYSKYVGENK